MHQALSGPGGQGIPPQDKQQFQALMNGWQAWIEQMSNPQGQQGAPQPPQNKGAPQPMPATASKGSRPTNISGG